MTAPPLPLTTRMAIFLRLLAIQSSWNYETLVGNGIGFSVEPALRLLPGGRDGEKYRAALARIERFRTALCGPLGATGDRLVWASWLPFSVLLGMLAFGLGGGPAATVLTFLGAYNLGHLALRIWGLHVGYARGMQVARSLGTPVLRSGSTWVSRAGAALAGIAIPLAIARGVGQAAEPTLLIGLLVGVGLTGLALSRLRGRYELWKFSLGILTLIVLAAMVRS